MVRKGAVVRYTWYRMWQRGSLSEVSDDRIVGAVLKIDIVS